jgi:hypothetical protein
MNPNVIDTEKKLVDLNIPVIYQSLSANTQNKLDRLNNEDGLSMIMSMNIAFPLGFHRIISFEA